MMLKQLAIMILFIFFFPAMASFQNIECVGNQSISSIPVPKEVVIKASVVNSDLIENLTDSRGITDSRKISGNVASGDYVFYYKISPEPTWNCNLFLPGNLTQINGKFEAFSLCFYSNVYENEQRWYTCESTYSANDSL